MYVVIKQRIIHQIRTINCSPTAEDNGVFLHAATIVLYGKEEAFHFVVDPRNSIIHLKLDIKIVKKLIILNILLYLQNDTHMGQANTQEHDIMNIHAHK